MGLGYGLRLGPQLQEIFLHVVPRCKLNVR
jgi:hypothetical protein